MDLALSFVGALFLLICVNLVWRGVGNRRRARAAAVVRNSGAPPAVRPER